MIRILVVDDHAIVRQGLRQILAAAPGEFPEKFVVGEAAHANEAIRKIRAATWDMLLLDMNLPGKSGLDALKQIKSEWPDMKVLAFSVDPEEHYALRALRAGAAGYITKSSPPEELLCAIRRVAAGGKYITQSLAEKLANVLGTPIERAPHENLTDREFQIFGMLAAGKTVSQIATVLSLSVKTISTHRSKVLHKLNLRNNAELMYYHMHQIPRTASRYAVHEEEGEFLLAQETV
jgi:DNA-binding NarL/FixJ family response regulator